jgi:ribonuclease T2
MRPISRISLFFALFCVAAGAKAQDRNDLGPLPPGQFDFYSLSLTWVPGFCSLHRDPAECGRGTGFALHGLWPESQDGYPTSCSSDPLPDDVRAASASLFASPSLIDHEWDKHGTCTGLDAASYMAKIAAVRQAVVVPASYATASQLGPSDADTIKIDFIASNPGMTRDSLVLVCQKHRVSELHICLTKDGAFRPCVGWEAAEDNCQ